VPNRNILT